MDYTSYINHHHQASSFDPQSCGLGGSLGVGGSMDNAAAAAGAAALSNMACSYADLSACAQVGGYRYSHTNVRSYPGAGMGPGGQCNVMRHDQQRHHPGSTFPSMNLQEQERHSLFSGGIFFSLVVAWKKGGDGEKWFWGEGRLTNEAQQEDKRRSRRFSKFQRHSSSISQVRETFLIHPIHHVLISTVHSHPEINLVRVYSLLSPPFGLTSRISPSATHAPRANYHITKCIADVMRVINDKL
ncbi:hypothetical protein Fcan01_12681 [Folsomia candida]|uniref:Uncharacterized protein n=1 Tax=Folsomia candida TaxID=158441 RepID=A0A226E720_FOLCA|nr:hypothetical protein Fcan01_12681 [Folsomia candida]